MILNKHFYVNRFKTWYEFFIDRLTIRETRERERERVREIEIDRDRERGGGGGREKR